MTEFTREEIDVVYRVMSARRDMRHFLSDPLDDALLGRLLAAAHLAPSVGLMQPWRFIRVQALVHEDYWTERGDSHGNPQDEPPQS